MKYPKEYLQEIKTRLKISTVVSKTVGLKKRGKEYVGLSPFKTEKTPSFTVNDEKEFYHCFSTAEHGNIFDFVMKTQNLKFGESVKYLANLAGMRPYTFSKADEIREEKWNKYKLIYAKYVEFYHQDLFKNPLAKEAKDYLKNRNLTIEEVKKFKIGYVSNDEKFKEEIFKEFTESEIKETGLFYFDENKKKYVDRFRDRVIFPINNISGDPIALGGRILKDSKYLAKYINSPETPFFKKGSNLYNLDFTRKLSNNIDNIFLVEGYMDVVGLSKNKVENVVANLGTSLTTRQILTLNQFFQHIIVCFDGDESGYKAALRAAENSIIELKPEKEISFLFLPNKHDPDSYVNEKGKDYFEDFSKNNSVPIHKFIFNHYSKEMNDNPSSRAIFEKKLRSISSTIKDDLIRKYVLEYFLEKISELTPNTNFKYNKNYSKPTKSLKSTQNYFNETKSLSAIDIKEFSFLYILLKKPELIKDNFNLIENVKLFSSENKLLLKEIIDQTNNFENTNLESLKIDQSLIDRILKYASIKHILFKNLDDDQKILEILSELIRDLKNYELELRIMDLESRFSKDLSETTFNELKELKKQQKIN
ncbi:DNA primase [Pelagibacterales bacterium SAG-MED34]|nr:DNA primase [Pelagibacterales bacterium SAG-MED34]